MLGEEKSTRTFLRGMGGGLTPSQGGGGEGEGIGV